MIELDFNNTPKFLINLDKRIDRYEITSKLLYKYGYDFQRFSAIDSILNWDDIKLYVDDKSMQPIENNYRKYHHELSKGAVGCYLSHYKLWMNLLNSYDNKMIIFEDDTLPTFTYYEIRKTLNKVPKNWDIILFGGLYHRNNLINEDICKVRRFYCLHAYMISKSCVKKLKNTLFPIKKQIDSVLSEMSIQNKINIYGLKDQTWMQNPLVNSTDIQTPMKSKKN